MGVHISDTNSNMFSKNDNVSARADVRGSYGNFSHTVQVEKPRLNRTY